MTNSMLSLRMLTCFTALPSSSSSSSSTTRPRCSSLPVPQTVNTAVAASLKIPCNLEAIESDTQSDNNSLNNRNTKMNVGNPRADDDEEEGISKIRVPRQKYIPVSKSELLDGIISALFDSKDEDANQFLLFSSCLDSILHAEHKRILEQMRSDYFSTQNMDDDERAGGGQSAGSETGAAYQHVLANGEKCVSENGSPDGCRKEYNGLHELPLPFTYGLDLRNLLGSSDKNAKSHSQGKTRLAVATRFQHAFMQLLSDAQFEELSVEDLALTSALNTDYLLTLPIYVDWKRASESNAIIFRRGYATERQKGLLIVEKLDYIQSKLLRGIFSIVSKPLGNFGNLIKEAFSNASNAPEIQDWTKRMKLWLKELYIFQQSLLKNKQASDSELRIDQLSDRDLPIWLAAQKAVSRYEGLLAPVGPRERLLRKLLAWIGLIPPPPEKPFPLDSESNASEPYLRSIFLSRMTLSDIWKPASNKLCGNDFWKKFKTSISILLSPSILQEPAFEELILLYTKDMGEGDGNDKAESRSLQLKIYERIPIPDLPFLSYHLQVIFPHKKLSFRIIDTVRLDAATILGLLAYFINYKFEDILSSPSAIFLDVIAVSALIIYVTRVALGYKQTWDRYQLLVNKTLYEKTLAGGFGSVHFLLDASQQQQYKEAILMYAVLLKGEKNQDVTKLVSD
ncbi:uncharacterized protein LOC110814140 isoform X3 [Carica papaya]|uniref:uncharacterized protein LOC110814140 isoform X3 n=1 Tax=Carica papaya TaxID=3649 RepID=UPI000B8C95D6|nr:uncharacterized protein LOC110814140 isoform X3 [Carica papaya]